MSRPGHHQRFEGIGDVLLVHRGLHGQITGVLISIDLGDPLQIAVLSPQWPEGLAPGTRLWFVGQLGQERVSHKKNTHYVQAVHVDVVKWRKGHG